MSSGLSLKGGPGRSSDRFWFGIQPGVPRKEKRWRIQRPRTGIVMGSDDVDAMNRLETLYKEFHGANFPPVIRTSHENAELIKYASNSMLATKISFINTVATIAEKIPNTDITTIAKGVGLDQRIG